MSLLGLTAGSANVLVDAMFRCQSFFPLITSKAAVTNIVRKREFEVGPCTNSCEKKGGLKTSIDYYVTTATWRVPISELVHTNGW